MGEWTALDEQAQQDYLNGYLIPLDVRETEHGVEVWMPHRFSERGRYLSGTDRICWDCGLLPMGYDRVEVPCVGAGDSSA